MVRTVRSACAEFGIPIMGVLGETVTDASLFVHILRMPADADEFVRATLQVLSKLKK